MEGRSIIGWRVKILLIAMGAACLSAIALPVIATGDDGTPTWQLKRYYSRGLDRSFKCDLVEEMPKVPRVVVYGGSRGLRMDPATIRRQTGLTAFNGAFHNGRPEDAWAVTDWLIDRNPDRPPTVIWCVQATYFADVPMAAGLIVDERLSQAFSPDLIAAKMPWAMKQPKSNLLSCRRYYYDGMLLWNTYDRRRKEGLTLRQALDRYLDAKMLARAGNRQIPRHTRAMTYFKRTLKLLNANHIRPVVVVMPYHPRVLKAFYSVGWGVKQQWLIRYLHGLQKRYRFRILNCLNISTFGGNPNGFYDGAHLTASNSRRLIRYIVKHARGCFRVPEPTPSPSPSPSSSPSPSPSAGSPAVSPPDYVPVPEETGVPADLLE